MNRFSSLLLLGILANSFTFSQPTNWEWALSAGGISYSDSRDVAADGAGKQITELNPHFNSYTFDIRSRDSTTSKSSGNNLSLTLMHR